LVLGIAQFISISVLLLSAAGYLGRRHKYLELASHFKLQYLLASLFCLLICVGYQAWGWSAIALSAVAINLAAIAPWYLARPSPANNPLAGYSLKLMHANVYRANTGHEAFIALVRREEPDVVIIQEVDEVWDGALKGLRKQYPFFESLPRSGGSGMALYSRIAFERTPFVSPEGDVRPGISVNLEIEGAIASLLAVHPRAPIRRGHFLRRNAMLAAAAAHLQNLPAPKICIGDLNTSFWSPYYRCLAQQTGMINARKGFGLLPSWPTFMIFGWAMIPIDHCLVSDDVRVVRARTGERIGSDHLPLIVELEIPPALAKQGFCKVG
jgi:endonuclease/exonuclease/phosphatase (EEP) superfamily protein YafD